MNGLSAISERMIIATAPQKIHVNGIFTKVICKSVIVSCLNVPNTSEMAIQHIAKGRAVLSSIFVY
jgi:hypothetical protein